MRKLRQEVDVPLSAVTHDIDEIRREYYRYKGGGTGKETEKELF